MCTRDHAVKTDTGNVFAAVRKLNKQRYMLTWVQTDIGAKVSPSGPEVTQLSPLLDITTPFAMGDNHNGTVNLETLLFSPIVVHGGDHGEILPL